MQKVKPLTRLAIFLAITAALPCSLAAQNSFSATPELVIAEKPANLFVFYNYAEFLNLTGDTLEMRWVQTELTTSLGGDEMGDWTTAITDPENMYNPNDRDSADFTLLPTPQTTDKFIYQLFPHQQPGTLTTKFKFYPVNDPVDSLVITFQYTATDPSTPARETAQTIDVEVFPNPAANRCQVSNRTDGPLNCQLMGSTGQRIESFQIGPNGLKTLDLSTLPAGIFHLKFEQDGSIMYRQISINR